MQVLGKNVGGCREASRKLYNGREVNVAKEMQ